MKISFSSMMGTIPRGARTQKEVSAAGVSIRKEERSNLSVSDQLKLSKAAREGGSDKFSFFETDGKIGSEFKAVYNMHMQIEALSKALAFFDMDDVFKIIPDSTVANLEQQLLNLFACQDVMDQANTALADDDTNQTLLDNRLAAATSLQ